MPAATFRNPSTFAKSATFDNEQHATVRRSSLETNDDLQQSMPTKRLLLFHNLLGSSRALVTQVRALPNIAILRKRYLTCRANDYMLFLIDHDDWLLDWLFHALDPSPHRRRFKPSG